MAVLVDIELRVREIGRHIERYESRLEAMKARGETSGRDAKEEESEGFKNDGTRGICRARGCDAGRRRRARR